MTTAPKRLVQRGPSALEAGVARLWATRNAGAGSEEKEVNIMETKQWEVKINISEEGKDTHVRAVLTTMDGTTIEGVGHARRNPRDRAVPEIGDELAAGRALIDLGHRLVQLAATEIAGSVAQQ
jgi:hypothetical protein